MSDVRVSKAGPIKQRFLTEWKLASRDVSNGIIPTLATIERLMNLKRDLTKAQQDDFVDYVMDPRD